MYNLWSQQQNQCCLNNRFFSLVDYSDGCLFIFSGITRVGNALPTLHHQSNRNAKNCLCSPYCSQNFFFLLEALEKVTKLNSLTSKKKKKIHQNITVRIVE